MQWINQRHLAKVFSGELKTVKRTAETRYILVYWTYFLVNCKVERRPDICTETTKGIRKCLFW